MCLHIKKCPYYSVKRLKITTQSVSLSCCPIFVMLFEAFLKPISTSLTTWMVSLGGIYNRHTVLLLHREEEKLKEMKYKVDI